MALTCPRCQGTGFRGRLGVFELLEIDDDLRALILVRADGAALRARALAKGMKTMFAKALLGETTLDEVLRVTL